MKQFRYNVAGDGQLVQGQWVELGNDKNGKPNPLRSGRDDDLFWVTEKRHRVGSWALDENDTPYERKPQQDAEEQALIAIEARQQYAPRLIAKISLKITTENVLLAERLTLNPLISSVTVLLQAGSFQDALAAINAQSTAGLSEAAINVLLYADEIIQDAVDNYY